MLTLRQMDSIVHNTLLIFEGFEINRREEGTNIFYDVHDRYKSKRRFLGTYRVWEWHDGSGRSQWMPLEIEDSEIADIRHKIWEAIMAIAIPANQSTEPNNNLPNSKPVGVDSSKNKSLPRIPKQAKRLNDWKAAWRKVKGRWKNGDTYIALAQVANCSPETIADIVKAGEAGLLD